MKNKITDLNKKMDALSNKLSISDELLSESDNILDIAQTTKSTQNLPDTPNYSDIMNLDCMIDDFQYIRETLKEITDNAKRVQNVITLKLLDEDDKKQANLIISFAELSKSITDAQKLYIQSYKEMSATLLNLTKLNPSDGFDDKDVKVQNNTINITNSEPVNTADLIKKIKGEK